MPRGLGISTYGSSGPSWPTFGSVTPTSDGPARLASTSGRPARGAILRDRRLRPGLRLHPAPRARRLLGQGRTGGARGAAPARRARHPADRAARHAADDLAAGLPTSAAAADAVPDGPHQLRRRRRAAGALRRRRQRPRRPRGTPAALRRHLLPVRHQLRLRVRLAGAGDPLLRLQGLQLARPRPLDRSRLPVRRAHPDLAVSLRRRDLRLLPAPRRLQRETGQYVLWING